MKRHLLLITSALSISLGAAPAFAQSAASNTPEATDDSAQSTVGEIIVTAQRRDQKIQDVPIAISAFSADELQARGVTSALDLGQFVPNLIAQNNTGLGSANAYYIRGLGNTETIPTFDPPVGTYVDDVYLSRQNANNLNLFDVERVEVLRGPQGTLFGRNTTGGAINVILRQPKFGDLGGYAEVGYGSYNKKLARASIDVPLASTFSAKVSGYWQDDDGYARNVTTGQRLNDQDGWGVRLGLRGELASWARWSGAYAHIEDNSENLLNFDCNPAAPTQCDGRFITTGLIAGPPAATSPYAPLVISGRKANYQMGNYTQTDLITSNLQFDVATDMTVSLITGYVSQRQQYALDFFDGRGGPSLATPTPPVRGYPRGSFVILNDGKSDQFSQEIKINGKIGGNLIDYVAGFYYIEENNKTDFADVFGLSPTLQLLLADRTLTNRTQAYAGYVQADLNLTRQITLTAGVRYTDETKTFAIRDNRPQCNVVGALPATCLDNANLIAPSGVPIPTVQKVKLWTPRFAINFKPTDDILLFASATRGFKSGGWNARSTAANALLPFGPEKVWSYELGVKSEWLNHRIRANVTLYQEEVSDLQTPSALVGPTGAITFLTRNFADYRNRGVEAELTVVPVDGLNIYANVGYQDDAYKLKPNQPPLDVYGIQSVAAQAAACQALIAAGAIPGGTGTAPCAAGIVTARGTIATPVRTPDFTVAVGGSYSIPVGRFTVVPSVNGAYHSYQEVQTSNYTIYSGGITGTNGSYPANPFGGAVIIGSASQPVWLVNAGIALNGPDKAWQLSLNCTNCLDAVFSQSALANTTYINQPAMWTIRARYNF
ncbi:MAG: TonB-dependent receptor [Sphingomonas sp. 28-66-16]|nr:MAG: TonB-dependent receptor [Sphingomonas sp. 28-66-16]